MGEVQIKFNQPCKTNLTDPNNPNEKKVNQTDYQNLHLFNISSIEMYVEPAGDWHLDEEGFELTRLNFTWNATRFEKDIRGPYTTLYI